MDYAGFWIRVAAYLIDFVPLIIINIVIGLVLGVSMMEATADPAFGLADLAGLVIGIAYFVGFESSSWQATPGKRVLGLVVTDSAGQRISPLRALGRYFAKILSAIILAIGFIMVAFTERKQGLHDMIAGTLVVKGSPGTVSVNPSVFE